MRKLREGGNNKQKGSTINTFTQLDFNKTLFLIKKTKKAMNNNSQQTI